MLIQTQTKKLMIAAEQIGMVEEVKPYLNQVWEDGECADEKGFCFRVYFKTMVVRTQSAWFEQWVDLSFETEAEAQKTYIQILTVCEILESQNLPKGL